MALDNKSSEENAFNKWYKVIKKFCKETKTNSSIIFAINKYDCLVSEDEDDEDKYEK